MTDGDIAIRGLLSAAAVRERAHEMLEIGVAGGLEHWRVDLDRLPETARYVAAVIRDQYPTLAVPFHARWRHFAIEGQDFWSPVADARLLRLAARPGRRRGDRRAGGLVAGAVRRADPPVGRS